METKWLAKSLTIWGGIVMGIPAIVQLLKAVGIDIGIGQEEVDSIKDAGVSLLTAGSALIGLIMVGVGRMRANTGTPVTLLPTK